jgi:hypothetical protein
LVYKKIVGAKSGCPWNGVCSSAEVGIVLELVFTFWEFCGIPGAKIRGIFCYCGIPNKIFHGITEEIPVLVLRHSGQVHCMGMGMATGMDIGLGMGVDMDRDMDSETDTYMYIYMLMKMNLNNDMKMNNEHENGFIHQ